MAASEPATAGGQQLPSPPGRGLGEGFRANGHRDLSRTAPPHLNPLPPGARKEESNGGLATLREPPVIGVDVARFGTDHTVICVRRGDQVIALDQFAGIDTMETAGHVAAAIRQHRPDHVYVDEIGIGAGVVDRLREQGLSVVQGVNVARTARRRDQFANLRAELYDNLRQRFEQGRITIPDDPELVAQLTTVTYHFTSTGQVRIDDKDTLRYSPARHSPDASGGPSGARRGSHSPDKADALALAFAETARRHYRVWTGPPGGSRDDHPELTLSERRRLQARAWR